MRNRRHFGFSRKSGFSRTFTAAEEFRVHKHKARCAPGCSIQTCIGWGGTLEKDGVSREAEPGADEEESADRDQEVFGYDNH